MMTLTLPRILLVDDEVENLRALERTLRRHFQTVSFTSPLQGLDEVRKNTFAVVISDLRMAELSGTEFLARVAELSHLSSRVMLTAHTDTKEMLEAINRAEIYRYITKPWNNEELTLTIQQAADHYRLRSQNETLLQELEAKNRNLSEKEQALIFLNQKLEALVEERTTELTRANEKLKDLAMTDPLTRLLNRRSYFQRFLEEIERSKRYEHTMAVAMIDVDHFKPFNDREGHLSGDEALKRVAGILTSNIRKTDVLCRYGGEEFSLMMPETRLSVGRDICERLRTAVEKTMFQGLKDSTYLTISIGLSGFPEGGQTTEQLLQSADHALYEAKQRGRNQISVAA